MTIGCNIWMICLKLNRFFYGLSRMLHLSEFVWILRSSVFVVFNNFLLIDATDRSKIRSDQKRFFYRIMPIPPLIFLWNFSCFVRFLVLSNFSTINQIIIPRFLALRSQHSLDYNSNYNAIYISQSRNKYAIKL